MRQTIGFKALTVINLTLLEMVDQRDINSDVILVPTQGIYCQRLPGGAPAPSCHATSYSKE